jgi:hypothetical protein
MPEIPAAAINELAINLTALQGRAKASAKREFLSLYQISPATLSRKLNSVGCRSHARSDRGRRRAGIDDQQLAVIAAVQASSLSLRKGIVMPAKDAIEIAVKNDMAPEVSPSLYNRWLREQSGSRRDQTAATPHIELRSLGPNHVHQVDFSLAVNWKVENNRPMYEHLIYKNKLPAAGVPRILRLIVVDHATGCFYAHYTVSAGETVQALLEGLYYAWSEKKLNGESIARQYPFRGVPSILMADRGSAMQAGATAALMNRLGIHLNICEGARSKGAVEVSHNWWEAHFETRLRLQPPQSIEQLNEWAIKFAAHYCGVQRHTRHGSERSTMWAWYIGRRPESQLRELRCDFETFKAIALSEPQRCKVGGSRIVRFKSRKYRVPECFLPNTWVEVQYSPFSFPEIQVRAEGEPNATAHLCSPIELDEFGFPATAATIGVEYKGVKHTAAVTFAHEAQRAAKELVDGKGVEAFGYHLDRTPEVGIPTAGEGVEIEKPAAPVMTRIAAREMAMELIGRTLTVPEAEFVNGAFGEQVTEAEVYAAVDRIQRGITGRVVEFRGKEAM